MPVISIISPVYCEGENIIRFLDAMENTLAAPSLLALDYEILLVDDGSTDDTWKYMCSETLKRPKLRCLRLSRNFGKEAALAAGLETATGDAVITLDSDLQHPPTLIPEMIRLWQEDKADVVEASKEKRQKESLLDRLAAIFFYKLLSLFASMNLKGAGDFKLMDRTVVDAWKTLPEHNLFFRGMNAWLGFRRQEIFYVPQERQNGGSKWSFVKKVGLALDSLTSFSAKPMIVIWILTFLFFVFAFFMICWTLWMKFTGNAVTGFTTVNLLILITGSAVLAAICILSVYIRQIFYESKGRPRYLVSERTGYGKIKKNSGGRAE